MPFALELHMHLALDSEELKDEIWQKPEEPRPTASGRTAACASREAGTILTLGAQTINNVTHLFSCK